MQAADIKYFRSLINEARWDKPKNEEMEKTVIHKQKHDMKITVSWHVTRVRVQTSGGKL
jgi:hypothetical protein